MFFNKSLLKNESGAVSVEAALYFVMFLVLCGLVADYSIVFINKGRLERVNHSLSSIIRDRTALYNGDEKIRNQDVDKLKKIADILMKESRYAGKFSIYVDAIYFNGATGGGRKDILSYDRYSVQSDYKCSLPTPNMNTEEIKSLSPWAYSEKLKAERWSPLYQVSICVPGEESLFKKYLGVITGNKLSDILVSNIVVPR